MPPWKIKVVDADVFDWVWTFVLTPIDDASCRLLARVRADYRPHWLRLLLPFLLEPVHFIIERKMLRTIERQTRTAKPTGLIRAGADAAARTASDPA